MGEDEIKLSELTNTNLINDEDILMIVQNGVNKKITIEKLLNAEREKNTKLEEDIEKLKISKRKILWENNNPSASMGADTIINLSSSDYDELIWFYKYNLSDANSILQMSISCQKGNGVILQGIGYSTNNTIRRILDRVSDSQYKARIGKTNSEDSTDVAIPVAVIGIKH